MTRDEFFELLIEKQIEWLEAEILKHEDNYGLPERSKHKDAQSYRLTLMRFANDLYKEVCDECDGSGEDPMFIPSYDEDDEEDWDEDNECSECDGDGFICTHVYEGISKIKEELVDKYEGELK